MFIRKWPKCTEMYIPIFIYIHFIYLRSHFWKRPQTLVCLFSFAHCFPLFNFWPLAFEAGWFTRKQILSLRLVCRTFIRQDSGRGEEKEAGMGRRSWSVKHSQKNLSQPPWKRWSWNGPSELSQDGKRAQVFTSPTDQALDAGWPWRTQTLAWAFFFSWGNPQRRLTAKGLLPPYSQQLGDKSSLPEGALGITWQYKRRYLFFW